MKKILLEIGHPAHVHFFRHSILRLTELGHRIYIVTRNKDVTNQLLDRFGLPYECLSQPASGKLAMAAELAKRWLKTIARLVRYRIDVAVSISGITTSLPARLCRVPNIVFTDTEDARLTNRIAFPFADVIYTPEFFLKTIHGPHRRYAGLHELAYLQDFDFDEGAKIRTQLGLPEKYSFIRMVANDALHDRDVQGIRLPEVQEMIRLLEKVGQVYLSCEGSLPPELASYKLPVPIERIHAILAGAQVFLGESPTMAVESSLLGTPAFLVSQRAQRLGNMICLERDHKLLINARTWADLREKLAAQPDLAALKRDWTVRAEQFRTHMPRMNDFVTQAILEDLKPCAA